MSESKVDLVGPDPMLTAAQVLQGGDDPLKKVELKSATKNGKPGVVWMKAPSAAAVLEFSALTEDKKKQSLPHLIAGTVVHKDGKPLFEDPESVSEMSVLVFQELQERVMTMMGIDSGEIAKNSPTPEPELSTN